VLPTSITLTNYRSFAGPVRLELRPITLLYGINNAGKSALLRALPLLADSVATTAIDPLDLESPAARGSSFQDLRWKGIEEDEDRDLGVSFQWADAKQADFFLHWEDLWSRLIIRRFVLSAADRVLLAGDWKPLPEERTGSDLSYLVDNQPVKLGFRGLVPYAWPPNWPSVLASAAQRLRGLSSEVQWLAATRRLPENRVSPAPSGPRRRLKPDGSDVETVLAGSPELLSEVSSWYEKNLQRTLRVREVPGSGVRLVLQNLEKAAYDVDIRDTGEGMIQVLPVLTATALGRQKSLGGPGILAIEEPESHLHARLQRSLAEWLCDLAATTDPPRLLLETHSEHLLLGIQLQIVQGRLRPEDVLVYWVRQLPNGESFADPVTFDRDARPQGAWPPGVFADDTEVAREIIQARREREAS